MTQCSRRNFLKTGLAVGVLAGTGRLPLRAARDGDGLGYAGEIQRESHAPRVRHGNVQRTGAA